MKRKYKILILAIFFTLSFIAYQTITHKTEITKFLVKTILEHKKENAFEFANKFTYVVPNYANKDGFEIVSKEDYEKYQQGYCLAENRILDKKELYKRAVINIMTISHKIHTIITEECPKDFPLETCNYGNDLTLKNGFYKVKNLNEKNFLSILEQNYNKNEKWKFKKILIDNLNMTKINIDNFLQIKENYLGFNEPIVEYLGLNSYRVYFSKAFIFFPNNFMLNNSIYISEVSSINDIKERIGFYNEHISKDFSLNEYMAKTKHLGENKNLIKIDNCGNNNLYKDIDENNIHKKAIELLFKYFTGG